MPGLEIRKRKGHLVITDRYPNFLRHQLVELGYLKSAHSLTADSVAFNVQPRRTGQILIGSSRQYDAGNKEDGKEVDTGILVRMLRRAQEYMPELAQMSDDSRLDGISCGNSRQVAADRPVAGRQDIVSGDRTRRPRDHDFVGDGAAFGGSARGPLAGSSDRTISSVPGPCGAGACLIKLR